MLNDDIKNLILEIINLYGGNNLNQSIIELRESIFGSKDE